MLDLAVVGLGLIGSAALRHGVVGTGASVVGIGPAEPEDWLAHRGPFASHYDSGRVTRRIDAKHQWAVLASRAIAQYPLLEASSGIDFHRPSGVVFVRNDPAGIERLRTVATDLDLPVTFGSVEEESDRLSMLCFPDRYPHPYTVIGEPAPAGAIDPRRMVRAQHQATLEAGATIERDTVVSIRPVQGGHELLTEAGRTHRARRVLIAAGSYSNSLLQQPLAVAVRPEWVVLGQVSPEEAERLEEMPSVLYLLEHPELDDVYIVPPMQYPDGKWYIKIGGSQKHAPVLSDVDAMNQLMRNQLMRNQLMRDQLMGNQSAGNRMAQDRSSDSDGGDEQLQVLREVLQAVLPDVRFEAWRSKPCLITDTESGLPYVDQVESGIWVAFGGNGHAAKSSDALGALAAGFALEGRWTDRELAAEDFTTRIGAYVPPAGSRHGN